MLKRTRQRQGTPGLPIAALSLGFLLPLTGCLSHTRAVEKHRRPDVVLSAPLDQLLRQVDDQYNAVRSATVAVEIVTSTGGALQGQVKEITPFKGYIILGNPDQIRLILQVPLLGSKALDMVSDGKTFEILIPSKKCAITGSDQLTDPAVKGIYSLRPGVILDSMLIRGLAPGQLVSRTQDIRVVENPRKKKDLIEEPDYDLEFLSQPVGNTARSLRVLHISRADLLPYRQDIYDADGKVATQAFYSDYKKFGTISFPSKIVIQRPLDELSLTITVTKGVTFNQTLDADQFKLDIPEGTAIHNMDKLTPNAPATNPCDAHEPPSPR